MGNKILGLDLGSNSVGWALIDRDQENQEGSIVGMGSRIIPMSQDVLSDFAKGVTQSQTAERTRLRGVRRLRERHLLRRERLHRVLHHLDFLPEHYDQNIDFEKRLGQFHKGTEPKLAYNENGFIFQELYKEMEHIFQVTHPTLFEHGKKIPFDWTIYFLRKKALTEKISDQELAWLLLHFNQKRGYYQLRGEEEEEHNPLKLIEFHSLKIVKIEEDETEKKGDKWYSLHLDNGWIYRRKSKVPMDDWLNKTRDFIVTTDLNEDGSVKVDKEGNEKRSFRAPKEDDWTLRKKKSESEIEKSGKTVGAYIFDEIVRNPKQKVRGKFVSTIERKFYKEELIQILNTQLEQNTSLNDSTLFETCIKELYPNNLTHQSMLLRKDFIHLFVNDIIFYQRPLRSQKSLISNCPLEKRCYKKDEICHEVPIKTISKSHPLYQEFRLWQWVYNVRIYNNDDKNVTEQFLSSETDYVSLYEFLFEQKEIKQDTILRYFIGKTGLKGKELKSEIVNYKWNYADRVFPANETRHAISTRLKKVENLPLNFLSDDLVLKLWHIIYSVTDKIQFERAMATFAQKHELDKESFVEQFKRIKPYTSDYGAYSEKAIKRLLPLMRCGSYWKPDKIDEKTLARIDKLLTGEVDESIRTKVREQAINLNVLSDFQGLPQWLASYVVYDKHSEGDGTQWKSIDDLKTYIHTFKQHSLRNPIVEQVVLETLRTVHDIWKEYGNGADSFFNEIHVELSRDLKNPKSTREKLSKTNSENQNTNLRIKTLLAELLHESSVESVRPYSPYQQDILKIYEDGALNSAVDVPDDILKISKLPTPSKSQMTRYKCWLEQHYRSPYTGRVIPMSRLFTSDYEIEHIIPKSRYYDDSFSNKVICESAVNKLKGNQTGMEFILNPPNNIVEIHGKPIRIFSSDEYTDFVKKHYAQSYTKRQKLLSEDLPEKMIQRQLNDTRYISKFVSGVLSSLVRLDQDDDGYNSKNLVPGNGKITSALKQDWGLNSIWNQLILPRFERLNALTETSDFTAYNERYQTYLPTVPLELSKNFQKKRIDHRHHAMDALIIACTTRSHVNYSSNKNAIDSKKPKEERETLRYDLRSKLCKKVKTDDKGNGKWEFIKPWSTFTEEAKSKLQELVISFKQNTRVLTKSTNYYDKWVSENGHLVKRKVPQTKGKNQSIRKSLHKDTVSGQVTIREVKTVSLSNAIDQYDHVVDQSLKAKLKLMVVEGLDKKKISSYFKSLDNRWNDQDISKTNIYYYNDQYTASRVSLDTSFDLKKIASITDTGIQKILINHYNNYRGVLDEKGKEIAPETLAFSPEGIDDMNKQIIVLNDGKHHQPIRKVRKFETLGNKFQVGESGQKSTKYVEAAKGTNLFFGIYQDSDGKRSYETIPLHLVIERRKQGLPPVPEQKEIKGGGIARLIFYLSPNDLVYVPSENEQATDQTFNQKNIYKMVSSSGSACFFIPHSVAISIVNKKEFSALNKMEKSLNGQMIKSVCKKLKVDRLGKITDVST